jgi:cytochrome c-type biogenesis protein CcmH
MTTILLAMPAQAQEPAIQPTAPAAAAFPEGSAQQLEFLDISKDLRCPTCTGLSVLESDAPFSNQIKDIVKEQVQAGKSKDEILKYFTERYGPWILRSPPKEGFNLVAWGLPIAVLLAGPPLIWLLVWRRRRVVATMGVRSTDAILVEMQQGLNALRGG